MDPDDNDATIANPSSPGIEELSEEYICLNIGPRTEEREGGARTTHLLTESKDGIFRSSTNTSTQELGAEVLPEQSRTDQGRPVDWQAVYEQRLHKSKDPKRLAKYYKMPFAETDSQRAETDSQRAERLNKKREHHRKYVANQTEEERAKRLDNARRRGIRRRAAETEDEREKRLALAKKKKAEKRDTK